VTNPNPGSPPLTEDWIAYLTPKDIQTLGYSLRQIDPTWTHGSPNETVGKNRIWYQGHESYFDVMVETQEEQVTWCQVTLRGRVLSWRATTNRIETGETEELDMPPAVTYYAASKNLRTSAEVDMAFVDLVTAILATRHDDPLLAAVTQRLRQASPNGQT
jgi:hypothetical protein